MNKRSYTSFAFLFTFWIIISGAADLQHIVVGIFLSAITVWFWQDLNPRLPRVMSLRELLHFGRCILMLIAYVIKSNIEVAKILLFSNKSVTPLFLEMDLGVKSNWGRVFLASCITITPGTITVDFDPETDMFHIHALTIHNGINLYYWSMITEIENLERLIERRDANVANTSRIHDSNSISATESDDRTNGS